MRTGHREFYGSDDASAPAICIPEVAMVGWDRFPAAETAGLDRHQHPVAYEICYLADGSVDWWVEDEQYTLRRGDVYITRPGEQHGGLYAVMQPCELYWVQVVASRIPGELEAGLAALSRRVFSGSPEIADYFEQLLAEHRVLAPFAPTAARAALHSLIIQVLRDSTRTPVTSNAFSPAVATALQLLSEDLATVRSIEWVAQRVGVSPPRLVDRFLQEVGETPGEWRTRRRLDAAKSALVQEPETTVTEIAFRLGFASSQYFATVFKRYVGLSPREWRGRLETMG